MPDRRSFLLSLPVAAGLPRILRAAPSAPAPFGVLPSARQLLWHEMEVYSFLHFTTIRATVFSAGAFTCSRFIAHSFQLDCK